MNEWSGFNPQTARWFAERYGEPTEIQHASHPAVAAGENVLITAPTGSGKTLAAFLYAIDRLLSGAWPTARLSVLYVSPLKALNTDIRENLTEPLAGLGAAFPDAPTVRAMTRSGDTPQSERRSMLRNPPDILTTTPESLNLLLSSRGGRSILGDVRTVILDEVHAVAGTKRGVHLATAVERLARLSGEFQRIALSATVRPLEAVAHFVGAGRPVRIIESSDDKALDISVHAVQADPEAPPDSPWVPMAAEFARIVRSNRSSLFFTTNRRDAERIAMLLNEEVGEQVAYAHHGSLSREVRQLVEAKMRAGDLSAIVATSSLELGIDIGSIDEVIFAKTPFSVTSCLQMTGRAGHQVGARSRARMYPLLGRDCLDAVVVGRAALERDIEPVKPVRKPLDVLAQVLLSMIAMEPQHLDELFAFIRGVSSYEDLTRGEFDAVVDLLAGSYRSTRLRDLEPRISVDRITGIATARPGVQRLLYHSGGTIPDRGYYELRRAETGGRVGELDEEFVWERRVGEVFVLGNQAWRIAKITDRDVLVEPAGERRKALPFWRGEPVWRHAHLSQRLLTFLEAADEALAAGTGIPLPDAPGAATGAASGNPPAGAAPPGAAVPPGAAGTFAVAREAAGDLEDFLRSQREHTGVGLPHRRRVVIEELTEDETGPTRRIIVHTLWGGALNFPFSLLLAGALEAEPAGDRNPGPTIEVAATAENDAVLIEIPVDSAEPGELAELVDRAIDAIPETPALMVRMLRGRLEATGFFGGRFRENAGRALLLPRAGFDRRMPLWMTRRRSRRLLDAVARFEDFPITVETWRTCLDDYFDLEALSVRLGELHQGAIDRVRCTTHSASPFARNLLWETTNTGIYELDTGTEATGRTLTDEAIRRTLLSPGLRPELPAELVEQFRRRLQRTEVGYAPTDGAALIDWVTERVAVPAAEWQELLAAIGRDATPDTETEQILATAAARLVWITGPGGSPAGEPGLVMAAAEAPRLARARGVEPADLTVGALTDGVPGAQALLAATLRSEPAARRGESQWEALQALLTTWMRYEPPRTVAEVAGILGLDEPRAEQVVAGLVEEGVFAEAIRVADDPADRLCDMENLERLLRRLRSSRRAVVAPRPAALIVPFLASWQGVVRRQGGARAVPGGSDALKAALEPLLGYPAAAGLWEEAILPARVEGYRGAELDRLLRDSDLLWASLREREVFFAFRSELELLCTDAGGNSAGADEAGNPAALLSEAGRLEADEIALRTHRSRREIRDALRAEAWRGRVTADSFAPVREGVLTRFASGGESDGGSADRRGTRQGRIRGRARWQAGPGRGPLWFSIADELTCGEERDLIDEVELEKDRARVLLDRYGIVFRELLGDELSGFRWGEVFGALRLMELAGEVLAGQFFDGIRGVQFARPEAVTRLETIEGDADPPVYALNAADPASPCGWGLEALDYEVPRKHPGTWLAFHGAQLLLVARRQGSEVAVLADPDAPGLPRALDVFRLVTGREFRPPSRITVKSINGADPTESPYRPVFEAAGFRAEYRGLVLWAGYR